MKATTPAAQAREREEQRRLFFVGITRSTETLVLSSAIHMPNAQAFQMHLPMASRGRWQASLQASCSWRSWVPARRPR